MCEEWHGYKLSGNEGFCVRVAITGGAGFIGRHLIRELCGRIHNLEIRVLDTFDEQVHDRDSLVDFALEFPNLEFRKGSIVDESQCEWLVSNADVVFHLAAETGTGQSMYEMSKYTETNVLGTARLLEAIVNRGSPLESFVLASSRSIYGEGTYGQCFGCGHVERSPHQRSERDLRRGIFYVRCNHCGEALPLLPTGEDCTPDPRSYYALTKLTQEQQLTINGDRVSKSNKIFRFQNVYGPGQSLKNPYTGILAIFSGLASAGSAINVFEDGLESRDFVWVGDVARVLVDSMTLDAGAETITLNLGTGTPVNVLEVATAINKFYGEKSQVKISGDFRIGDIRHNMSCTNALNAFGIETEKFLDFHNGLYEFLRSSNHEGDAMEKRFEVSMAEMRSHGLLISGE